MGARGGRPGPVVKLWKNLGKNISRKSGITGNPWKPRSAQYRFPRQRRDGALRKRSGPAAQGHSKKALGGEEDGIETVLGQGLANGRERSRQRPR